MYLAMCCSQMRIRKYNNNVFLAAFQLRMLVSKKISRLRGTYYSFIYNAQVSTQIYMHSLFLRSLSPMGEQSDTTEEKSGAGSAAYRTLVFLSRALHGVNITIFVTLPLIIQTKSPNSTFSHVPNSDSIYFKVRSEAEN